MKHFIDRCLRLSNDNTGNAKPEQPNIDRKDFVLDPGTCASFMHWITSPRTQKSTFEYLNVDRIGSLTAMRRRQQTLRQLIQLQTQNINRKLGELSRQSDYFARYYAREQLVCFFPNFKINSIVFLQILKLLLKLFFNF